MTTVQIPHPGDLPTLGTPITTFAGLAGDGGGYGAQLRRVPELARAFRAEFASSGRPDQVITGDLASLAYPTRFGLWRAARTLAP
ncbi:MAG TPA: hypothetical protein VGJ44_13365, partial [Kribbellaceae bacterium]